MLLAQPTLFDRTRAPAGKHTAWAYCHVPNGSGVDMTEGGGKADRAIRAGISQADPEKEQCVAASMESYNPNLIGGDIGGGAADLEAVLAAPHSAILSHA